MKTDIEILEDSYNKYKDKTGTKAKALKDRIECFRGLRKIQIRLIKNSTNLEPEFQDIIEKRFWDMI